MRRHGHYGDTGVNPMISSQMQHVSGQRMQQSPAMSNYLGQRDHLASEDDKYMPPKAEGRWQWDRDDAKGSTMMSSHQYKEGQGSDASRSRYQGSSPESKFGLEKRGRNKDSKDVSNEQDLRAAYEDASMPRTLESLEQNFLDEIMKLAKELHDAEDAEISRHRERIGDINAQYQEKVLTMRARQASRRDEFLRQESQARQQSYQQLVLCPYPNSGGHVDPHGCGPPSAPYGGGHLESSYREPALQGSQNQGFESRGSYQGSGKGYNNSRGRYY